MKEKYQIESFEIWKDAFLKRYHTKCGFEKLDQHKSQSQNLYPFLQELVLEACYNAYKYQKEGDILSYSRLSKSNQSHNIDNIIRSAKLLEKHIGGDVELNIDIFKHGLFLKEYECNSAKSKMLEFEKMLNIYIEGLEYFKETLDPASSFYDTCQEGNMIYRNRLLMGKQTKNKKPIKKVKKESLLGTNEIIEIEKNNLQYRLDAEKRNSALEPKTHLIFELAVYFKLWTIKEGQKLFDKKGNLIIDITLKGTPLPPFGQGKPLIPIITDFVNATFECSNSKPLIKERYSKLPKDANLIQWRFQ